MPSRASGAPDPRNITLNKAFYVLPFALLAAACPSSSSNSYGEQPTVDDHALMSVPAFERDDIDAARTQHSEAVDAVAVAEREAEREVERAVERAERRVTIAKHDIDIAGEEIDAAKARLDPARGGHGADRQDRIDDAHAACGGAHAHAAWARAQVELEQGRVEQGQARVAFARQRIELAGARIELAKAGAVHALERPDLEPVDVTLFERAVSDEEVELKLAEIDAEACQEKLDVRQDALEARAKSVPASYRKEQMPMKDEPKSQGRAGDSRAPRPRGPSARGRVPERGASPRSSSGARFPSPSVGADAKIRAPTARSAPRIRAVRIDCERSPDRARSC